MSNNNINIGSDHQYNTRSKDKQSENQLQLNNDGNGTINKQNTNDNKTNSLSSDLGERTFSKNEYQQLLAKLFPSNYMNNKLAKKSLPEIGRDTFGGDEDIIVFKGNRKISLNKIKKRKLKFNKGAKVIKMKIINLTKNSKAHNDDYGSEFDSEGDSDYEEDEDEIDSENDDDDDDDDDDDNESESPSESELDDDDDDEDDDDEDEDDDGDEDDDDEDESNHKSLKSGKKSLKSLVKIANLLLNKRKRERINTIRKKNKKKKKDERELEELKIRTKNNKEFNELLKESDNLNDSKFFKKSMHIEDQEKIISELKMVNKSTIVEKPYRIMVLQADIPLVFKTTALKKISMLESMDPSVGEYFKIKQWIDNFMQIPFNRYSNLPVSLDDGLEKCNEYMEHAIKILDGAVYGMNDAKMQIMQLIGQWITNPDAPGNAIAIKGPMGTGKTSLVKDGISKILNRPFSLITLGGATDSCFLEGHSYTYEGSNWGKIVDILIQTKCSNPIIYFDELDKVSDTPKGEEIIGILTHLIDSTQNRYFQDKYFSEINFNLSKALFIFSYNDDSKINPILRDRMYRISTRGYDAKEKLIISNDYLLPKICQEIKFKRDDIEISDDVLKYIVEKFTEKEDGVRNLKRCLEVIYTKINLFRLMKAESSFFKDQKALKIEFPFKVTEEIVDKLIKKEESNKNWLNMYM